MLKRMSITWAEADVEKIDQEMRRRFDVVRSLKLEHQIVYVIESRDWTSQDQMNFINFMTELNISGFSIRDMYEAINRRYTYENGKIFEILNEKEKIDLFPFAVKKIKKDAVSPILWALRRTLGNLENLRVDGAEAVYIANFDHWEIYKKDGSIYQIEKTPGIAFHFLVSSSSREEMGYEPLQESIFER